jgi:hypothetical protein
VDEEASDHRIWGAERGSPQIHEFFAAADLLSIAKTYLRADVTNCLTLGAKLVAAPASKGSGGGWHRDSLFEKQFKAILYLSDVTLENGPYQYVLGSNSKRNVVDSLDLPFNGTPTRFHDVDFDADAQRTGCRVETVTAAAGDLILTDTRGIHRGMPIVSGTRYALTNYYAPNHRLEAFHRYFQPLIKL